MVAYGASSWGAAKFWNWLVVRQLYNAVYVLTAHELCTLKGFNGNFYVMCTLPQSINQSINQHCSLPALIHRLCSGLSRFKLWTPFPLLPDAPQKIALTLKLTEMSCFLLFLKGPPTPKTFHREGEGPEETKRRGASIRDGVGGPASTTQRKVPAAQPARAGGGPGPHLLPSEGQLYVSSQVFNPVFSEHSTRNLSLCLPAARSQLSHQRG